MNRRFFFWCWRKGRMTDAVLYFSIEPPPAKLRSHFEVEEVGFLEAADAETDYSLVDRFLMGLMASGGRIGVPTTEGCSAFFDMGDEQSLCKGFAARPIHMRYLSVFHWTPGVSRQSHIVPVALLPSGMVFVTGGAA